MKFDNVPPLLVLAKRGGGPIYYRTRGLSSLYFLTLGVYIIHSVMNISQVSKELSFFKYIQKEGESGINPGSLFWPNEIQMGTYGAFNLIEKKTNKFPNRQYLQEAVAPP